MTDFDRVNPLFERICVPFEIFQSSSNKSVETNKTNGNFTVRILQGHRPQRNGNGRERVIRFEMSDECNLIGAAPLTLSNISTEAEELEQPRWYQERNSKVRRGRPRQKRRSEDHCLRCSPRIAQAPVSPSARMDGVRTNSLPTTTATNSSRQFWMSSLTQQLLEQLARMP
mmetsp:Transcript_17397/g.25941  ORF Transcript_17397/g.25941 Transcript_17397/m.25941 type:complete len:171 (-) Transcript_17397:70-582(-)